MVEAVLQSEVPRRLEQARTRNTSVLAALAVLTVLLIAVLGITYLHRAASNAHLRAEAQLTQAVNEHLGAAASATQRSDFEAARTAVRAAEQAMSTAPRVNSEQFGSLMTKITGRKGAIEEAETDARARAAQKAGKELIQTVEDQLTEARSASQRFEFEAAWQTLGKAEKLVAKASNADRSSSQAAKTRLAEARNKVEREETEYHRKIQAGWVVFEGELIPGSEREQRIAERDRKAAEQKQRKEAEERRAAAERKRAAEEEQRREAAKKKKEALARAESLKSVAYTMSQEFIRRQLKAPSTARFPDYGDPGVSVRYDPDKMQFSVYAWVDAQNSFGVFLRSSYICILWPTSGDMWESSSAILLGP
jgi:hypothetical protein